MAVPLLPIDRDFRRLLLDTEGVLRLASLSAES